MLIEDVKLFDGRIDLNNASVGAKSDKLLSFAQLRFVVASYLLGKRTRVPKMIERGDRARSSKRRQDRRPQGTAGVFHAGRDEVRRPRAPP